MPQSFTHVAATPLLFFAAAQLLDPIHNIILTAVIFQLQPLPKALPYILGFHFFLDLLAALFWFGQKARNGTPKNLSQAYRQLH